MPKPRTNPVLLDEVKTISVTDLKRWGYLNFDQQTSGIITWSFKGEKTGSVNIRTGVKNNNPFLELSYNYEGNWINYILKMEAMQSNLGKGNIWYFICPATGYRCRKLYLIHGRFLHREAVNGCMYESQTRSQNDNESIKLLKKVFKAEEAFEKLHDRHFKRTYKGKPTKRYLKLIGYINQCGLDGAASLE